jgi:hypothetical protein
MEAEMLRRWRSRPLLLVLPLTTARALCARAHRVDEVWDAKRGMRTATVPLHAGSTGAEARAPVGWCRLRWYDGGEAAVLELLAWDARRSEADAWAAIDALAGEPVRHLHRPGADR